MAFVHNVYQKAKHHQPNLNFFASSVESTPKNSKLTFDLDRYIEERLQTIIMNTATDRTQEFLQVVNLAKQRLQTSQPQIRTQPKK